MDENLSLDAIREYLLSTNALFDAEEWVSHTDSKKTEQVNSTLETELRKRFHEVDKYFEPAQEHNKVKEEDVLSYVALNEKITFGSINQYSGADRDERRTPVEQQQPSVMNVQFNCEQLEEANRIAQEHAAKLGEHGAYRLHALRESSEFNRFNKLPSTDVNMKRLPVVENTAWNTTVSLPDRAQQLINSLSTANGDTEAQKRLSALKTDATRTFAERERLSTLSYDDVVAWHSKENEGMVSVNAGNASSIESRNLISDLSQVDHGSKSVSAFLQKWLDADIVGTVQTGASVGSNHGIGLVDQSATSSATSQSQLDSNAHNEDLLTLPESKKSELRDSKDEALERLTRELEMLRKQQMQDSSSSQGQYVPQHSSKARPRATFMSMLEPRSEHNPRDIFRQPPPQQPQQSQQQQQYPQQFQQQQQYQQQQYQQQYQQPPHQMQHPFAAPAGQFPGWYQGYNNMPPEQVFPNSYLQPMFHPAVHPMMNPAFNQAFNPIIQAAMMQSPYALPNYGFPGMVAPNAPNMGQGFAVNGKVSPVKQHIRLSNDDSMYDDGSRPMRGAPDAQDDIGTHENQLIGNRRQASMLSRQELKHKQEIRRMQQEMEKLKLQKELEDFKVESEKSRIARTMEDTHAQWLAEQAQKLQSIKMEIALAKEKQLLNFHSEAASDSSSADAMNTTNPKIAETPGNIGTASNPAFSYSTSTKLIRQESGVGLSSIPLSSCTGAVAFIDGLIVGSKGQLGSQYRLVLGIYDGKGKIVARVLSSDWAPWRQASGSAGLSLQLLTAPLKRSAKASDIFISSALAATPEAPEMPNPRCVVEVQYKESASEPAKLVGWSIFPLRFPALNADASSGAISDKLYLCNGLWKVPIWTGLADLQANPFGVHGDKIPDSWVLCRIVDMQDKTTASGWTPSFKSYEPALELYEEPNSAFNKFKVQTSPITEVVPGQGASVAAPPGSASIPAVKPPGSAIPAERQSTATGRPGLSRINSAANNRPNSNASQQRPVLSRMNSGLANNRPSSTSAQSVGLGPAIPGIPETIPESSAEIDSSSPRGETSPVRAPSPPPGPAPTTLVEDKSSFWLHGTSIGPATERYQRGDGIDIYIDAARFLPDNVTTCRVIMKLFTQDKEQIGIPFVSIYQPGTNPAMNPVIKMKAELRDPSYNATATILIRFDTIDCHNLQPTYIGYACLKLFALRDRKQPKFAQEANIYVNTGMFQLPLRAGKIPALETYDETFLDSMPRIPCASVLVRVYPAPKSGDGLSSLGMAGYPPDEWERLGIQIPPPSYGSGAYFGGACEPDESRQELVSYSSKAGYSSESYDTILSTRLSAPGVPPTIPPRPTGNNIASPQFLSWVGDLLPPIDRIRNPIDYSYSVPYASDSGLSISIDCLYNLPDSSSLFSSSGVVYKVVYSLLPPGLFYKEPPLSENVKVTLNANLDSPARAPSFSDGYNHFFPPRLSEHTYLLLDIRSVKVEKPTAPGGDPVLSIQPPSARTSFWTMIRLSKEMIPGKGFSYVNSGTFVVPLIEDTIEKCRDVLTDPNPWQRLLFRLEQLPSMPTSSKLSETGAGVIVRITNPLTRGLMPPEQRADILFTSESGRIAPLSTEHINTSMVDILVGSAATASRSVRPEKFSYEPGKYSSGSKAKTLLQQLPPIASQDPKKLLKQINKEFATAVGL